MKKIICDLCEKDINPHSEWISFTAEHKGHFGAGMDMMPREFHAHHACWFKLWPGISTKAPILHKTSEFYG